MADSIQSKRENQSYLRQIQQEKSQKKRDIMQAQKEDMKAVRDFYAQQSKQLESDSAAAINHIKQESRQIAADERQERSEKISMEQEEKRADREQRSGARTASKEKTAAGDNKTLYTRGAKRSPTVQNYQTKETDDFYRVQDRGSRVTENPEAYIIEAYAPEHEKDDLRVSIQRNKAVVSGQRKFADEAEDGKKKMTTNNYQSFREEFAFDRPVSQAGMTRERVGDYIRFSIPKMEAVDSSEDV